MSARADILATLAMVRNTHAHLKRHVARHLLAADVLAKIEPEAATACKHRASRLMLELVTVRADLRRVEQLAEMQQ